MWLYFSFYLLGKDYRYIKSVFDFCYAVLSDTEFWLLDH